MNHDLRAKIIRAIIHKVEVLPESYRLHFYVGKDYLRLIQGGLSPAPSRNEELSSAQKAKSLEGVASGSLKLISNFGSKRLTNGRRDRI